MGDTKGKVSGQVVRPPSMHPSWIRLYSLVLLLVALVPEMAHAEEDKTLLRAREGAAALMRGQYDKAIASYDEALTEPEIADDIDAKIYRDRGVAERRLTHVLG